MSNYLTPGVYTEEVSTLPPSVAGVSTAVPAFIGYTAQAVKNGKSVAKQAVRISTFLEFKEVFGNAQPASFSVEVDANASVKNVESTSPQHTLYYALDHYFKNGGGACYVISVGSYDDKPEGRKTAFEDGLDILNKEDEPTLIMLGEATQLGMSDYVEVCTKALRQCETLKDRFCILDIPEEEEEAVAAFRSGIGTGNLKYGAAYTPYLKTSIGYHFNDGDVKISGPLEVESLQSEVKGLEVTYSGAVSDAPKVKIIQGNSEAGVSFTIDTKNVLTIENVGPDGVPVSSVIEAWRAHPSKGNFIIESAGDDTVLVTSTGNSNNSLETVPADDLTLTDIKNVKSGLYNEIVTALAKEKITLPPSAAIAGVYATTDRERGVWKAPANVSLNAVISPTKKITSADQERLNVEADSGKSINAIRAFTGKGIMVWGARTLAGNDNEWRYIPVRRLFNTVEEATKKASEFAVFEPNNAVTWLKVKSMIESYMYGIWQQGALAGAIEEQAYFVNIGLGKTMTQQDILEGKMIVEIGIAAVRPAEFISLKFSHKLQEAN